MEETSPAPSSEQKSNFIDGTNNKSEKDNAAEQQPPSSSSSTTNAAANSSNAIMQQHQQTESQLEAIEREIQATQPLTSKKQSLLDALLPHYPAQSKFALAIQDLSRRYTSIRKVRGDGNCFYRAFLYSLCETLLHIKDNDPLSSEKKRIQSLIQNSMDGLETLGYQRFTMDMFWEDFCELMTKICNDKKTSDKEKEEMHTLLNEENAMSDSCTWYLRVLTAAQLKSDPDRFLPFLLVADSNTPFLGDIATFCRQNVEPMGQECSMVQVMALAEYFGMPLSIEYLDGHDVKPTLHKFLQDENETAAAATTTKLPVLTLLYRPGHYDILYQD